MDEDEFTDLMKKWAWRLVAIGLLVMILAGSFYTIQSGQEGVLLTFSKASPTPIQPGLHAKFPFIQKIVKFDMRTHKYGDDATADSLESAASSDLQIVKARVVVNYRLAQGKAPEVFTKIGQGYEDRVILPSVREAMKAATAKYRAEDLINKREDVRAQIELLLRQKLEPYNLIVEQVSITDFDFSEQYNVAIENKVTAEQNALAAKNKLEQVKIEAEQVSVKAEGEANAVIWKAKAEAENIRLVQEQLAKSQQYVDYIRAQRWNGEYPQFYMVGGQSSSMLFQVPAINTT